LVEGREVHIQIKLSEKNSKERRSTLGGCSVAAVCEPERSKVFKNKGRIEFILETQEQNQNQPQRRREKEGERKVNIVFQKWN